MNAYTLEIFILHSIVLESKEKDGIYTTTCELVEIGSLNGPDKDNIESINPLLRGPFLKTPPPGKSISECLSLILFYTVNYTWSSNLKGFCPSFKTQNRFMRQIFKNPKKSNENSAPNFLAGHKKLTVEPRTL